MVSRDEIGPRIQAWAVRQRQVDCLVLIGSRARSDASPVLASDAYSDWDFHIITRNPNLFESAAWLEQAGLPRPTVYVTRAGRLRTARKVTAIVAGSLVDVMVLPTWQYAWCRVLLDLGLAARVSSAWGLIRPLGTVIGYGYRVLHGGSQWRRFYARVARPELRLRVMDRAASEMADVFVCDYVSLRQKIARGEIVAAQRWLHVHLHETNLQLWHELQQRRQRPSMPDGRRIERLTNSDEQRLLRLAYEFTPEGLRSASEHAAETLRWIMHELVGNQWAWPDVTAVLT